MKITVTQKEYQKLKELLNIVKDKRNLPGTRRLAMHEFDCILRDAINRRSVDEG
ncbi:hypothetical protein [Bacillus smithii]|uniref:hypothetical protein n=1 Tax=Bacillus smithii TaxID=1479 RepID=UPI002E22A1F2|nr:hypothetical protein [Bacillus smithii]MED4929183.1 hypothetical protein [Bacillus smithii]